MPSLPILQRLTFSYCKVFGDEKRERERIDVNGESSERNNLLFYSAIKVSSHKRGCGFEWDFSSPVDMYMLLTGI
jgi:hypothetical protein